MSANNMRDIKRRIKSVSSTEHITNAMKLVSAGKLRKAKAIFEKTNANLHYITQTIAEIFHNSQDIPQEYLAGLGGACHIRDRIEGQGVLRKARI